MTHARNNRQKMLITALHRCIKMVICGCEICRGGNRFTASKAAAAISKKSLDDCNLYATTDGFVGSVPSIRNGGITEFTSITIVKITSVCACRNCGKRNCSDSKRTKANITIALWDPRTIMVLWRNRVVADPIAHSYKIKIE